MIYNKDRSKWFGASDTAAIMGNWNTPSFAKWWMVKLGISQNNYCNLAMQTGTAYEHRILNHIGIKRMDRQIKLYKLRLRVNLDGEDKHTIHEVKTFGGSRFHVSRTYWMQCQVEMFAAKKECCIVAYRLEPTDYYNWFTPIDSERISIYPIEYDKGWIDGSYLPRITYLSKCLKGGIWPDEKPH